MLSSSPKDLAEHNLYTPNVEDYEQGGVLLTAYFTQ